MMKAQMKTVYITSFSIRGIVCFILIPQGQAVSQAHCVEILTRLPAAMQQKSPEPSVHPL